MTTSRRVLHHRLAPGTSLGRAPRIRYGSHASNPSYDSSPNSPGAGVSSHIPINAGDSETDTDEEPILPPPLSFTQKAKKTNSTREFLWSNEATHTLIQAWGDRHLQLNRGSLKQHHWEQIAAAVNSRHADELRCTDTQARNRIDTLKKKYKKEKSKISESAGKDISRWPFYDHLDFLVGSHSPETSGSTHRRTPAFTLPPASIPVGRRSKRPATELHSGDGNVCRRKFETMTAAVGTIATEEEAGILGKCHRDNNLPLGLGQISDAIQKFGEIYERVEKEKVDKVIELEKQRMQLAMDLNAQTMNLISDFIAQFEKNKETPKAINDKQ